MVVNHQAVAALKPVVSGRREWLPRLADEAGARSLNQIITLHEASPW
jgi:hypothetical protein